MTMLIGVYGASGFGKEVMPLVRQKFPTLNKEHFIFIDDGKRNSFKWILSSNLYRFY
jgi:hypothetical protein